jgi:hypothetical protein
MASVICTNTLSAIQASCDALKRQGGIDSRIWLGSIADISSVTLDANGQIDTFTLGASKHIFPYQGKKLTNNAQAELTVSENGPSTFTHTVNATLFPVTGAQMKSVEDLLLAGGPMFAIIERKGTGSASNNGFEIYRNRFNRFNWNGYRFVWRGLQFAENDVRRRRLRYRFGCYRSVGRLKKWKSWFVKF